MVYSDSSTLLGIVEEIDALCDSTSTSYPLASKTRRVNAAYESLVGKLIQADGTWEFDDTNYTTTPVGTGTLVEGQSSYSFSDTFLDIERVKVLDKNGHWHFLDPIDPSEIGIPLEELLVTNGFPYQYDKNGNTIRLYPAPTSSFVTLASGLKVEFKRTASLFTATDTTKVPGFASPYHIILAYMAAIPYCVSYKKDRVAEYKQEVVERTADMIMYYSRREKDKRKIMSAKSISSV